MRVKTPITRREFLRNTLIGVAGVSAFVPSLAMVHAKDFTSSVHPPGIPNIFLITPRTQPAFMNDDMTRLIT